ncbi:hypothetical protein QFZ63_001612 [Streptomyces sp. B3I7]|uniref:hypothetical protein n=1 Tax=Streptomyces sp. B3I7 TaxID=3042269 RepID=UPI00278A461A|nr:hypothetical protein [Streptomyces sp. B3I7]MDQ0809898.1 hypothetical protein [Streptomyces sp. B3I7]
MTTDLAVCLAAGRALNPWIDNAVRFVWWIAPGVAFIGLILAAGGLWNALAALARRIQAHRNRVVLPPAADNQPGTDTELLEHCQKILNPQPRKEKP